jgi:hypothetical protein
VGWYTRNEAMSTESDLVIATTGGRELVRIKPDGTLIYGPEYTPDEAAMVFWKALAQRRAEATEQELVFRHMETALLALGRADLENEIAQMRAKALQEAGEPTGSAVLAAHKAEQAWLRQVHEVTELARGLAERAKAEPATPSTDTPLN